MDLGIEINVNSDFIYLRNKQLIYSHLRTAGGYIVFCIKYSLIFYSYYFAFCISLFLIFAQNFYHATYLECGRRFVSPISTRCE